MLKAIAYCYEDVIMNRNVRTTLIVLALVILGLVGFLFIKFESSSLNTIKKEREVCKEKVKTLEEKIAVIKEEIETKKPSVPEERLSEVFGAEGGDPFQIETEENFCEDLEQKILNFFQYLDKQDYIASYDLKGGTHAHFNRLLRILFKNPPIISGETESSYRILKNIVHFYKVLGRRNISLCQEILSSEDDIIESTLGLFYQWIEASKECEGKKLKISIPLKDLYEYAGFFLNTLGGRSYLLRQKSHKRMLVKYYSILIIDKANSQLVNRHGIDIRYPIESLIDEMETSINLIHREDYLQRLHDLNLKYQF